MGTDCKSALSYIRDFFTYPSDRGSSLREIKGLHDAVEFNKLKIIKAIGDPEFKFKIGKTLDEVEEIVILKYEPHTKVPGVTVVEYRIPTTDGKYTVKIDGFDVNKGYTTVATKGESATKNFKKTIYDPQIWADAKLEKALKEALQNATNTNGGVINREWHGVTNEGYEIMGYFENGKVTTFWFE